MLGELFVVRKVGRWKGYREGREGARDLSGVRGGGQAA